MEMIAFCHLDADAVETTRGVTREWESEELLLSNQQITTGTTRLHTGKIFSIS